MNRPTPAYETLSLDKVVVMDIETYPNYFLLAMKWPDDGKAPLGLGMEIRGGHESWDEAQRKVVRNVVEHKTTGGFNSWRFDMPLLAMVLIDEAFCQQVWQAGQDLINGTRSINDILSDRARQWMYRQTHVDIKEVPEGVNTGLKLYGARIHTQRLRDLPYTPDTVLTDAQINEVREYCQNDLVMTEELFATQRARLELRQTMSREYRRNLMSRSDAQIAEAVIEAELKRMRPNLKVGKPKINDGFRFQYQPPSIVSFNHPSLQALLDEVRAVELVIDSGGRVQDPNNGLRKKQVKIGDGVYWMGLGGLHSKEKRQCLRPDERTVLMDADVTSYYPTLILNQSVYPKHLGQDFRTVYQNILTRRLDAKKGGDKVVADSLKIVLNGTYGKLGSPHSILYAPHLMIQVTLTGQLLLLMLIERLIGDGHKVVSANTDGVVSRVDRDRLDEYRAICDKWQGDTGFELEFTGIGAMYSRDVNNYLVQDDQGKFVKSKGAFKMGALTKNPHADICIKAVQEYLARGTSLKETIESPDNDLADYVLVRTVKGGASWGGEYLGKVVRWVWSEDGQAIVSQAGAQVAESEGCRPVMGLECDREKLKIDFERYVIRSDSMLTDLGLREPNTLF